MARHLRPPLWTYLWTNKAHTRGFIVRIQEARGFPPAPKIEGNIEKGIDKSKWIR